MSAQTPQSYIGKDGYEKVFVSTEGAMNAPRDTVWDNGDIEAYSTLVPYDHKTATRVFFVSGKNGDEFGQFATKEQAVTQAVKVAAMSPEERRAIEG